MSEALNRIAVTEELRIINEQLDEAESNLQRARERVAALEAQAEILRRILTKYRESGNGHAPSNGQQLGATDAILGLLRDNPDGLEMREILDALSHKIATKSKNPRRLLASMVEQLKKKNRLRRGRNQKFSLMGEAAMGEG